MIALEDKKGLTVFPVNRSLTVVFSMWMKPTVIIFIHFLASQIWDLGKDQTNTMDFAEAIDNSDLESFGFTDDFIFGKF